MVEKTPGEKPLIQVSEKQRTLYFAILYGLFVTDFIARIGINSIMPLIQNDLNLTDGEIGTLVSCVSLGMAIFVLPISYLGAKWSTKKAITISSIIWGVGSLVSGMANHFYTLLISRFMVGSGNSAYAALSNSLITGMYKRSQWGRQIGIYNTGMTIGMALGAIFFANIADTYHWRTAFYTIGVISLLFSALSIFLPELKNETEKATNVNTAEQVSMKSALSFFKKNKVLLGVYLGAGTSVLVIQSILAYLSIYLTREMDMTVSAAAGITSILALLTLIGYPLGGAILDKWYGKDKRARVWMPAICFIGCIVAYTIGFYNKSIMLLMMGQLFYSCANTCFHAASQELVPVWFKSISYGTYVMFCQIFGAIGPFCTGLISDRWGISAALIIIQVMFAVSTIILAFSGFKYLKCYNNARFEEQTAGCNSCPE